MPPTTAAPYLPERLSLRALREAARACRGCDLYKDATQTVFGEGRTSATLMLVGETPGDQEDLAGRPFVGPAGVLLDQAIAEAGIVREDVYVTNVVKHFRFVERGKRRLHAKPRMREIKACRPWLDAELEVVEPAVVVCLGATAAHALLGSDFGITRHRGVVWESPGGYRVLATWHPSAILRAPEHEDRERMRRELADDLRTAAAALRESSLQPAGSL
jgi:DNA polymerase